MAPDLMTIVTYNRKISLTTYLKRLRSNSFQKCVRCIRKQQYTLLSLVTQLQSDLKIKVPSRPNFLPRQKYFLKISKSNRKSCTSSTMH